MRQNACMIFYLLRISAIGITKLSYLRLLGNLYGFEEGMQNFEKCTAFSLSMKWP